ncbi:hypothetical protein [uncultured Bdellovibrio sp.]|uniref:hypothetical protein n=1 Tax=Bdellovibrio sp. HCB-162 TaxID=3394234 RepID=UPI0025F2FC5F|nr:hypothetical protein [uncultured Bdellovibrio sp.]
MSTAKYFVLLGSLTALISACQPPVPEEDTVSSQSTRYLYVASGLCYSGTGNTTYTSSTASNVIFKVNLETGAYEGRVADFTKATEATGTTPVSISNYDDTHMMVLLEHTGQRRIELIEKKLDGARTTFYNNTSTTAPIGALQSAAKFVMSVADGFLISRTTAIEKLDAGKGRQAGTGTNAWVQSPGGACSASAVNITSLLTYPTTTNTAGYNIVYTHSQNASSATNNRLGVINGATGWNGTSGCLDDQSTVGATAYPTASAYMSAFKRMVVSYAGTNAALQNSLYSYAIDDAATSNIISDPVNGFENPSVIYGASAMTYDEAKGYLYVATGSTVSTNLTTGNAPYNIEKFSYNPTTKVFTRVGSTTFYSGNYETRCISSMFVGN